MSRSAYILALVLAVALAGNCSDSGGGPDCKDKPGEGFTCYYIKGGPVGVDTCRMEVVHSCNLALEWWSDSLSTIASVEFLIPVRYSAWYHDLTAQMADTLVCMWDSAFLYDGEGPAEETAPISGNHSCNYWRAYRRIGWKGTTRDTLWSMSLITDNTQSAEAHVKMQDGSRKVYRTYPVEL